MEVESTMCSVGSTSKPFGAMDTLLWLYDTKES
jgi:hypothetical protein